MNRLLSHRLQVQLNFNQIGYFSCSALSIQLGVNPSNPPPTPAHCPFLALHFFPLVAVFIAIILKENQNVLAILSQAHACKQTPLTRANMVILLE